MIAAIALLAGCGGDTHESLTDEAVSIMKEVGAILDGVKDEASADAAAAKIDALSARGEDLEKRMKALGKPTEEQAKGLEKKMGEGLAAMGDIAGKAAKAAPHMAKSKKLQDAFARFGKAMN
jgi:hypothetical protein